MERRKSERIPVNLNAALINEQDLPVGCRVQDVSTSGMLLRRNLSSPGEPLDVNQRVEIRVSLKDNDERKVVQLPLNIKHDDTSGVEIQIRRIIHRITGCLDDVGDYCR